MTRIDLTGERLQVRFNTLTSLRATPIHREASIVMLAGFIVTDQEVKAREGNGWELQPEQTVAELIVNVRHDGGDLNEYRRLAAERLADKLRGLADMLTQQYAPGEEAK